MTVTFGHAAHLATVWLPELTPTKRQVFSTIIAVLVMAAMLAGVAALFMTFCLERAMSRLRVALTFVAATAVILACSGGLRHITGTNVVHGAAPAATRSDALASARQAAEPRGAWKIGTREISATNQTVQTGWTKDDLRAISSAVAKEKGMSLGYAGAPAVIETTTMADSAIALHGTSFVQNGSKLRCVVKLSDAIRNNVGQPVRATVEAVRCVPAAPTPTPTPTRS